MCTDLSWQKPHWPLPLLSTGPLAAPIVVSFFFLFLSLRLLAGGLNLFWKLFALPPALYILPLPSASFYMSSSTTYILLLRVLHLFRSMAHGPNRRAIQHQLFLLQQCNAGHHLDPGPLDWNSK